MNNRLVTILKNIISSLLCFFQFNTIYSYLSVKEDKLCILVYHNFRSREKFSNHIRIYKDKGEIISLDRAVRIIKRKKLFESKFVITFDDGYSSLCSLLKSAGKIDLPVTIFLSTHYVDNQKLFWWDKYSFLNKKSRYLRFNSLVRQILRQHPQEKRESYEKIIFNFMQKILTFPAKEDLEMYRVLNWEEIKRLSERGVKFGAHSHMHFILTELQASNTKKDLILNKKKIYQNLNISDIPFAYPGGFYDNGIARLVEDLEFSSALTTDYGFNSTSSDLFKLKRIGIDETDWVSTVNVKISGLWGEILYKFIPNFINKIKNESA